MLKNVVLPAPFGPIRLTIECSGMSKSTSLTATRPPKTLVIPRASKMCRARSRPFPFSSGTSRPAHSISGSGIAVAQLFGALAVGYDALRSEDHHEDKEEAEQQEV